MAEENPLNFRVVIPEEELERSSSSRDLGLEPRVSAERLLSEPRLVATRQFSATQGAPRSRVQSPPRREEPLPLQERVRAAVAEGLKSLREAQGIISEEATAEQLRSLMTQSSARAVAMQRILADLRLFRGEPSAAPSVQNASLRPTLLFPSQSG